MHRIVIVILLSFFQVSAQTWDETQKVVASDRESDDSFGGDVSIDGNYMIVGARLESHDISGAITYFGQERPIFIKGIQMVIGMRFKKWLPPIEKNKIILELQSL